MDLADKRARVAVLRRIDRIIEGNFGFRRFLRDGVWELKIDFGPGYRVYYAQEEQTVVILLCAGSKGNQRQDIERAIDYWHEHQSRS